MGKEEGAVGGLEEGRLADITPSSGEINSSTGTQRHDYITRTRAQTRAQHMCAHGDDYECPQRKNTNLPSLVAWACRRPPGSAFTVAHESKTKTRSPTIHRLHI